MDDSAKRIAGLLSNLSQPPPDQTGALARLLDNRPRTSTLFADMPTVGYDPQWGPANMDQMREAVSQVSARRSDFDPIGFLLGLGGSPAGASLAMAAAPALRARPYSAASDALMGFRRSGPQKGFAETNYPHELRVRVDLGDGQIFDDAIKGLNGPHALERALRNWPDAVSIKPIK